LLSEVPNQALGACTGQLRAFRVSKIAWVKARDRISRTSTGCASRRAVIGVKPSSWNALFRSIDSGAGVAQHRGDIARTNPAERRIWLLRESFEACSRADFDFAPRPTNRHWRRVGALIHQRTSAAPSPSNLTRVREVQCWAGTERFVRQSGCGHQFQCLIEDIAMPSRPPGTIAAPQRTCHGTGLNPIPPAKDNRPQPVLPPIKLANPSDETSWRPRSWPDRTPPQPTRPSTKKQNKANTSRSRVNSSRLPGPVGPWPAHRINPLRGSTSRSRVVEHSGRVITPTAVAAPA